MQFNIYQLFVSTFIIHIIDTFAYSVRLNSVKSRQFALSNTLFNLFYLISLTAHTAYYAALLVDAQHRLAASASAGVINSAANIIFMLFVDPKSSIITDQALKGNRPYEDVKALVVMLMSAKLIGTLMGQVLLIPVVHVIATIYK
ncbi:ABC-type transporter [Desulfosporosinus sp. I2]|uniref:lipid II flippase family protein n=1 Tax=Desulfosporosinus sp. I2 TaxID=1617025 RepID=UPI0005EDECE4|nr:DUF2837 family protein [Desulfosporosinus sp. I2]KJR46643.1 ABC-type transporter [Desulfosporosinus sp. I2]